MSWPTVSRPSTRRCRRLPDPIEPAVPRKEPPPSAVTGILPGPPIPRNSPSGIFPRCLANLCCPTWRRRRRAARRRSGRSCKPRAEPSRRPQAVPTRTPVKNTRSSARAYTAILLHPAPTRACGGASSPPPRAAPTDSSHALPARRHARRHFRSPARAIRSHRRSCPRYGAAFLAISPGCRPR